MNYNPIMIRLGEIETSFLLAGGNPISGISHQGEDMDKLMINYFTFKNIKFYLKQCEINGINTIVARIDKFMIRVFTEFWNEGGKIQWIGQTAKEYNSILNNIKEGMRAGVSAIYIHGGTFDHSIQEQNYNEIHTCIEYCKSLGIPIGIASHNPQNLKIAVNNDFNNDFYLMSLHNVSDNERFLDEDRLVALQTLSQLDKPCLLYKILSAGRKSLAQGFQDVKKYIRPQDGVILGMCPRDNPNMVQANAEYVFDLRNNLFLK